MGATRDSRHLRQAAFWLALAAGGAVPAAAGTLTGTVTARGPEIGAPSSGGAYASHRYSLAERVDYAHLEDFVVYIDQAVEGDTGPSGTSLVTQHNVGFEPHVLPIRVGTRVFWPNKDTIFHNVFSMSEIREFDLGLYLQEKTPDILFDKVGRVDVYCSIHAKMHCIILVLPSRYFARTDAKGNYVIPHVPPGTYRLKAWQERVPPSPPQMVTVSADGETRQDFVLGFSGLPDH